MNKAYPFVVEVAADFGMFARLDCGSDPVSEVVPSVSAARGIIQAICWSKKISVEMVAVGMCSPPQWQSYMFNSTSSPLLKPSLLSDENACQIRASILVEPRFVLMGIYRAVPEIESGIGHRYQEQLNKRLRRHQCFRIPEMGWSDFPATYFGLPQSPVIDYHADIPVMGYMDYEKDGSAVPKSIRDTKIINGVYHYQDQIIVTKNEQGQLRFENPSLDYELDRFLIYQRKRGGRSVRENQERVALKRAGFNLP